MNKEMKHLSDQQMLVIESSIKKILVALGADINKEGLKETPTRVAKMYDEVFEGMRYTNAEIAEMFGKCFEEHDAKDIVVMKNIEAFSYCEHHLALIYNMKISVAYIPDGKVIGLSKIVRIVDMVCKRLQLQERITKDIADIMEKILGTNDVMVVVDGEHSCMTARGIKKPGAATNSVVVRGSFRENASLREDVYSLLSK